MSLDRRRLYQLLDYDPQTGFFTWKVDRTPSVLAGMRAGTLQANGYIHIKIDEKVYKGHRLAWFYVHGRWPEPFLDHKNQVKSDNWLSNLREATRAQNNMNRRVQANSRSGVAGVGWNRASKKWCARVTVNGDRRNIGFFERLEDAIDARAAAVKLHYGEFASIGG